MHRADCFRGTVKKEMPLYKHNLHSKGVNQQQQQENPTFFPLTPNIDTQTSLDLQG